MKKIIFLILIAFCQTVYSQQLYIYGGSNHDEFWDALIQMAMTVIQYGMNTVLMVIPIIQNQYGMNMVLMVANTVVILLGMNMQQNHQL